MTNCDNPDNNLDLRTAREQFAEVINIIKDRYRKLMLTKEGRNLMRLEIGAMQGISSSEVEIEGYPRGME